MSTDLERLKRAHSEWMWKYKWDACYKTAMSNPLHAAMIRALSNLVGAASVAKSSAPKPAASAPARHRFSHRPIDGFDGKRLGSGEKPDD